jgi:hypothetical protein
MTLGNAPALGGANHGNDLTMDGRLAARKLHHLRIAFGCYQVIEDIFHLFECEVEPGKQSGEAI